MTEPGANELAQARQWLHWWSKGPVDPPPTPKTRTSLKNLAKALDGLDPAARFVLYRALGAPAQDPIDSISAATKSCRASVKISRGKKPDDYCYAFAVKFLVLAWRAKHQCSPVTEWEKFQEFAGGVTKDYQRAGRRAPIPGADHVRRWL